MDDRIYIAALLDVYGELLKERQKEIMNMHFFLDYSLSEIGEELNISRQGAHDIIKRSVETLNFYEEKLSLVKKKATKDAILEDLKKEISSINIDEKDKARLFAKLGVLEDSL